MLRDADVPNRAPRKGMGMEDRRVVGRIAGRRDAGAALKVVLENA